MSLKDFKEKLVTQAPGYMIRGIFGAVLMVVVIIAAIFSEHTARDTAVKTAAQMFQTMGYEVTGRIIIRYRPDENTMPEHPYVVEADLKQHGREYKGTARCTGEGKTCQPETPAK